MGLKPVATLEYFDGVFSRSSDPWFTRSSHAEVHKRKIILGMMGRGRLGRVLELGCGNGSNTVQLARRALSLDACDGSVEALRRADSVTSGIPNLTLRHTPLPARFPCDRYDAIVIAELLYYLDNQCLSATMREIDRTLRPGGLLLLCHHHRQFDDAAQRQAGLHERFIRQSRFQWASKRVHRTSRWTAQAYRRYSN
jgi:SAM-dependent methyltransferase